ncbi:MAG: OmpA-OmpF porin, family [Hydrocarboniphaga sp.]|uniref:OmpA family protein n=1 Tax=Hydrocarboniphaga sp. TaxID=2033016 RepID=UPI0026032023|nr:OmpA family protein [Hydrocarboniphaga sp.]MDB5972699.1 OmpA-OmpF porin, family [Hydrocarboniphaga sp.]
MSSRLRCLAFSAAAFCAVAGFTQKVVAADDSAGYEEPKAYVGGGAFWNHPDSNRNMGDGWGSRAFIGTRLDSGLMFEGNVFGLQGERDLGSGKDSAWGAGGDFLFPFTTGGFQPFVLAGGGYTSEKVEGDTAGGGYANAGLGFFVPLTEGLKLRTEGRYVAVFSDHASAGNDPLYDLEVGVALQADIGKRKPLDADGDGVVDPNDACPNTPAGVQVDSRGCPLDADGDGVPDYLDKCPNTPRGAPVNAQGCPVDSDGDGVADYLDKCPNTPRGATVDASGCPLDSDRDGVPDYADKCPNTPYGLKVDAEGCVREAQTIVLQNVNFEFNKATLTGDSKTVLDSVAVGLKSDPQMKVELAGHTDSKGSDAYNLKLSQSRANSVKAYLVTQGIPASRLTAKGYGESKPVASNDTDEGRAQNRRVEFRVLAK